MYEARATTEEMPGVEPSEKKDNSGDFKGFRQRWHVQDNDLEIALSGMVRKMDKFMRRCLQEGYAVKEEITECYAWMQDWFGSISSLGGSKRAGVAPSNAKNTREDIKLIFDVLNDIIKDWPRSTIVMHLGFLSLLTGAIDQEIKRWADEEREYHRSRDRNK